MATNETVKLNGNKAMSPAVVAVANALADVKKAKKARAPRMTCVSRVMLEVSKPDKYLVTLRSNAPLNDATIDKLVNSGNTLHALVIACKAQGVIVSFSDMGQGDAKNVWHRAKVVIE